MGQIATYKCINKGLDFEHVIDYLGIGNCKLRTWETICMMC